MLRSAHAMIRHRVCQWRRLHCLALGGADLTSAAGKMAMQVLAVVAEFELDLLRERTASGLARARAEGKKLGRPAALSLEDAA